MSDQLQRRIITVAVVLVAIVTVVLAILAVIHPSFFGTVHNGCTAPNAVTTRFRCFR